MLYENRKPGAKRLNSGGKTVIHIRTIHVPDISSKFTGKVPKSRQLKGSVLPQPPPPSGPGTRESGFEQPRSKGVHTGHNLRYHHFLPLRPNSKEAELSPKDGSGKRERRSGWRAVPSVKTRGAGHNAPVSIATAAAITSRETPTQPTRTNGRLEW